MSTNTGLDLFLEKNEVIIFIAPSFRFMIFTKALIKELACIFIDVHKSSTVGCPSKLSCQCAS